MKKIFFRLTKDLFPLVKDRHPLIYLEYGRIEVDDSSVKWISSQNEVIRLPVALLNTIFIGPGTTITHEAVKVIANSNTSICWIGDQSLKFYAYGIPPTADTRNLYRQVKLAMNESTRLVVARKMFSMRFPNENLNDKSLQALMGMEGNRVRNVYAQKAKQYGLIWEGRKYIPGKQEASDPVNRVLTFANSLFYGIVTSVILACGYSPRIGFIHAGSPLPFVYDIADLYKEYITIDLAFSYVGNKKDIYSRKDIIEEMLGRIVSSSLMEKFSIDIEKILDVRESYADSNS